MAANALEQSVLESKDKAQLVAIAAALGMKPAARATKATLIEQILQKTGVAAAPVNGNGDAVAPTDPTRAAKAEPAAAPDRTSTATADRPAAAPVAPPDEPKAEWELAVGDDAADSAATETTDTSYTSANRASGDTDAPSEAGDTGASSQAAGSRVTHTYC